MRRIWQALKRRFLPRQEWKEEIESHVAMRSEWNHAQGERADHATEFAHRQFGSEMRTLEAIRDLYPARLLEDFWHDLQHTFRLLRRFPGFSFSVIATTAIGIGAATTIFSIVDPLLFRSLPFRDSDRLVSVGIFGPIDTNEFAMGGMYLDWREHQTAFTSMTAMRPATQCDVQLAQTQRVPCVAVPANFLSTLGVDLAQGRSFSASEDQPRAPLTAVISDHLWRASFAADAMGRTVMIDDRPVRIVGVLPPGFRLPQGGDVDLLLPAQLDPVALHAPANTTFLRAFARLRPGITLLEARARMQPLFQATVTTIPATLRSEVRFVMQSVRDRSIREAKLASWMLLGAVLFLLLLACLTIANLLLARAIARREEFSMRLALGAGRGRLFRQSLTETMLLALVGTVAGCVLSAAFLRALVLWAPGGFLRLEQAHIDGRVLTFSLAASLVTTMLAGVVPALLRPAFDLVRSWQTIGLRRARLRQALVVLQLACSLVLLAGALLFGRSLRKLETQPVGLAGEHLVAATFTLSHARYPQAERLQAFYDEMERRLALIPGITALALSDSIPPAGAMHGRPLANIQIANHHAPAGRGTMVAFRYVTPSYFNALGIRIVRGRTFTEAERNETDSFIIVSERLARQLFGTEDPIGQRISLGEVTHWLTVVGVARDVKNNGLDVPASPEYYRLRTRSADQLGHTGVALIKTALATLAIDRWVRQEVGTLDPTLVVKTENVAERIHHLSDRPRFIAVVVGLFAATSLILAGTGLYGVISFLVTNRIREIAVRSALGATRRDLVLLVQRQTGVWTVLGVVIGAAASLALGRLIRGLLFETAPNDPEALASAALGLLLIAVVAAWRPSRRAARVDPALALRDQ